MSDAAHHSETGGASRPSGIRADAIPTENPRGASTGGGPTAANALEPGERIGFNGLFGWHFGKVSAVTEDGYEIEWDDGFDESGNPPYSRDELTAYEDVPEDERDE